MHEFRPKIGDTVAFVPLRRRKGEHNYLYRDDVIVKVPSDSVMLVVGRSGTKK